MKSFFVLALLALTVPVSAQKLKVYSPACEHKINPVGLHTNQPRLSWKLRSEGTDVMQTAYRIRVGKTPSFRKGDIIWDSGKVDSDSSVLVSYKGPALQSGARYFWQVKVWDNKKNESAWSEAAFWEMGLFNENDWTGRWIEPVQDTVLNIPAMLLRRKVNLPKEVERARAYVTAHGLYEFYVNGQRVGDQLFTPGWTSYNKRLQYQVYDVTELLKQGDNVVGAILGDGWYRGRLGWETNWGVWGKKLGLLCQVLIEYKDGDKGVIVSDDAWKSSADGPIVMNSIYDGETYDARKEIPGWSTAAFDDTSWKPVNLTPNGSEKLVAMETVPVKRIQELKPKKIFRTPKGTLVVDFGQNMVGWVRLKVSGPAGTKVTVRHAEVLDKEGEFYTANLRTAKATMTYILRGEGEETYEPRFTFFGFRYISVDGFPGELKPDNVTGVVIHSDMKSTGSFECSDTLLNQLQRNIVWGQKGNFLDVPTDCPQRDERLGWTGDAQAFSRTAAYNMDVAAFFTKWLKDVAADQGPDGSVTFVVPDALNNAGGSAGWADAATIIPWNMYLVYGDKRILEQQYESMKAWVGFMKSKSQDHLWNTGFHFGDWLFYRPSDDNDGRAAVTDKYMIAQCFFAHSTQLLINAAEVLGKEADAKEYSELLKKVKDAYVREYLTPSGRLVSGTQTAYVLALEFDMLPEELRKQAAQRLVDNIKSYGNHLTTGFLGTPYLCHVLTRYGHNDIAYTLLFQKSYPSWLYPVTQGATTIWERWDGQKPDSTFQTVGMNSFNHYAYGAIGDWMYRIIGGIEIGAPGYKKVIIQPQPHENLSFARASYESVYGIIKSSWQRQGNQMTVSFDVPPNTTAEVWLPEANLQTITAGKPAKGGPELKNPRQYGNRVYFEVGSGSHTFEYSTK